MTEQPSKLDPHPSPEDLVPESNYNHQNVTGEIENSTLDQKAEPTLISMQSAVKQVLSDKIPLSRSQMLLIALVVMGIGLWFNVSILGLL